jgi:hypothetical protein
VHSLFTYLSHDYYYFYKKKGQNLVCIYCENSNVQATKTQQRKRINASQSFLFSFLFFSFLVRLSLKLFNNLFFLVTMEIMPAVEYSRVVDLNNSVAHHIMDGDVVSALELSLQASIIVRDMIRRNSHQHQEDHSMMVEQEDDDHSHQGLLESPCIYLHSETMTTETTILSAADSNQDNVKATSFSVVRQNNNAVCYLHPHPIVIDANRLDRLQTRQQQETVISYSVLYNFGLCHHTFALVHSNNRATTTSNSVSGRRQDDDECRTTSLRRAIIFYEYAHDILSSCEFLEDSDLIHSLLGITNNLGHAHHFLQDDEKATYCFERIWCILIYIQTEEITITVPSISQQGTSSRHPLSLEGFLANASYHCIKTAAAPAA